MGLYRGLHVVLHRPVFRVGNVVNPQQALDFFPALVRDGGVLVLLVHHVIPGVFLGLSRRFLDFHALFKMGNHAVGALILVGRLVAGAADDQRSTGFINQDGINFVHDAVVVATLHTLRQVKLHVVAQVVEAVFVVGAVGYVGGIGFAALIVVEVVNNHAHTHPQEAVKLAHPLGIALGQVIIHRDHVDAVTGERIQIDRQRGDQRFTFAGLHFRDLAMVQHHAADQLNVKVAHVQDAAAAFAAHGKSLGQNLIQDGFAGSQTFSLVLNAVQPFFDACAKLSRLGAELLVRELFQLRLKRIDQAHVGSYPLDFPFVTGAKNLGECFTYQFVVSSGRDIHLKA